MQQGLSPAGVHRDPAQYLIELFINNSSIDFLDRTYSPYYTSIK